jgi:hypothetical protein
MPFIYLLTEARATSMPVGLLDPDPVSIKTMSADRGYSVVYLEYCLRKYAKKKFVMFVHNVVGTGFLLSLFQSGRRCYTSIPIEAGRQI